MSYGGKHLSFRTVGGVDIEISGEQLRSRRGSPRAALASFKSRGAPMGFVQAFMDLARLRGATLWSSLGTETV